MYRQKITFLLIWSMLVLLLPLPTHAKQNTVQKVNDIIASVKKTQLQRKSDGNFEITPTGEPSWRIFFADCNKESYCKSMTFYANLSVAAVTVEDVNRLNDSIAYTRVVFEGPKRVALQMDSYLGSEVRKDVVIYLFKRWLYDIDRISKMLGGEQ